MSVQVKESAQPLVGLRKLYVHRRAFPMQLLMTKERILLVGF